MLSSAVVFTIIGLIIAFDMNSTRYLASIYRQYGSSRDSNHGLIKAQAIAVLTQGKQVLTMINSDDYVKKFPAFYNASVGGHMRHSIDHLQRVVWSHKNPAAVLSYDERKRDTQIESDVQAAMKAIDDMVDVVPRLDLDQVARVSFMGDDKTFETYEVSSTIARELSFASHHSVHHLATIKMMMMQGMQYTFDSASTVGLAVSTVKDLKEKQ